MRRTLKQPLSRARQAGMSLLEIIIVIVLIGAVLTLVGSRVLGGADRGKANLGKTQIQTLASKVENYKLDTGRLPHAATLVSRRGEIAHLSCIGEARPGEAPKEDAIFRIASMTKPMPTASHSNCAPVSFRLRRFCNCGIKSASAT